MGLILPYDYGSGEKWENVKPSRIKKKENQVEPL